MNLKEWMNKNKVFLGFILTAIILGIFLDWKNMEVIIFAIFIGIIIKPISSRYLAAPALFFLIFIPFLLIFDKEDRAEEFAIYVYYFLIMSVFMGIYEVIKNNKKKLKNNN